MNNTTLQGEFLTIADVKKFLNISQSKAYELAHRKDFPVSRFGGSIRIPRDLFICWVEQKTRVPNELSKFIEPSFN